MKFRNKNKTSEFVFTAICLIVILIAWVKNYHDNIKIKQNMYPAAGTVVDYFIVGTSSPYLIYEYSVNGKTYSKEVKMFSHFIGCQKMKDCIGRRFRMYYSKKNPEKSKIDFDQEIIE